MQTIAVNDVYLPYMDCKARVQIFFGGSASGKSVFLAQRPIIDIARGGRNYLIVRQIGRTIRGSVSMELSDKYSGIIIERFYTATGITPELQL